MMLPFAIQAIVTSVSFFSGSGLITFSTYTSPLFGMVESELHTLSKLITIPETTS